MLVETPDGGHATGAFIIPNSPVDANVPITRFMHDIESLEELAGIQFFDRRRTGKFKSSGALCKITACQLPGDKWFEKKKLKQD